MEPFTHDPTVARPVAPALPRDVARIGRFRVTSRLGEGGMGLVYAAIDPALDRRVAIKVIRRELVHDDTVRERFLREARLAADLADPRICRVYEVGKDAGQLFIVMELLEGEPLSARLRRGAVPLAASLPIVLDSCRHSRRSTAAASSIAT